MYVKNLLNMYRVAINMTIIAITSCFLFPNTKEEKSKEKKKKKYILFLLI